MPLLPPSVPRPYGAVSFLNPYRDRQGAACKTGNPWVTATVLPQKQACPTPQPCPARALASQRTNSDHARSYIGERPAAGGARKGPALRFFSGPSDNGCRFFIDETCIHSETTSVIDSEPALRRRPPTVALPARAAKNRFKLSESSKGSFIGVGDGSNAVG